MCSHVMIPVDIISEHIRRDLLWPGQVSRILNRRVPTYLYSLSFRYVERVLHIEHSPVTIICI